MGNHHQPQKAAARKTGGNERRRFLQIAGRISATIGTEFFGSMVRRLAEALDADCVYVGEFVGGRVERVKSLASCLDQERERRFEYPLAGSIAVEIALGNPAIYPSGVQDLFPSDPFLREIGAQAFVGIPLNDSKQQTLGLIAAVYRQAFGNLRFAKSMLEIFGPRAAAELERKQAEEALRESEQRHKAFIARSPDAMWRIEFEQPIAVALPIEEQIDKIYEYGYLAECNDAFARFYGAETAEQLIGTRFGDLEPPSAPRFRNDLRSAIALGYQFSTLETRPVDRRGRQRYFVRSQCGIVEEGMLLRMWGTVRDITELRQAERGLAASEQRLTELLENLHLVAIMLDRNGLVSFCNDYLLQLTGWKAEEVIGKSWFDQMVPMEERQNLRAEFESAFAGQAPKHYEGTILGPDDRRWLIAWDSTVLRDSDRRVTGMAAVGRDITAYKTIEAQLRQAQKLESIGRLTGGVAHDFNNLLTLILGYTGMLMAHRDVMDPSYTALSEIKKTAEKGAALTHQLLAFSRRQRLHPTLVNLSSIVTENERMLRRIIREDIELSLQLEPSLGLVRADAAEMHQVLLNVVLNSRDAMPRGGTLNIATSNFRLNAGDDPPYPGMAPGPYVQVTISDTGVGMSPEVHSHLFEPFFTTKEPLMGTGLGLSTVYGIIHQSGGYIVVDTELNKGTTFKIFLPTVTSPPEPVVAAEAVASPVGGTEKILVVEDDEQVRVLAGRMLRDLGYQVLEASNAGEALQAIEQDKSTINLILTDVVMPGMGGPEMLEQVQSIYPGTKVLLMSGYVDPNAVEPGTPQARFPTIQKPFTLESLAMKVRDILDKR
jgi:PAS domain S-box-containing protein